MFSSKFSSNSAGNVNGTCNACKTMVSLAGLQTAPTPSSSSMRLTSSCDQMIHIFELLSTTISRSYLNKTSHEAAVEVDVNEQTVLSNCCASISLPAHPGFPYSSTGCKPQATSILLWIAFGFNSFFRHEVASWQFWCLLDWHTSRLLFAETDTDIHRYTVLGLWWHRAIAMSWLNSFAHSFPPGCVTTCEAEACSRPFQVLHPGSKTTCQDYMQNIYYSILQNVKHQQSATLYQILSSFWTLRSNEYMYHVSRRFVPCILHNHTHQKKTINKYIRKQINNK